jgi:hypothetical protein
MAGHLPAVAEKCEASSGIGGGRGVFDGHIFEFAGFEDLSAFNAFDEFTVFFASDDLHARVLAGSHNAFLLVGGRRDWIHKTGG